MSKIKKMLALATALSISASFAVMPVKAVVAEGVTTIIEEDFSEAPKGTIGDNNDVYVENGKLFFEDADESGTTTDATYSVYLGEKTSGMISISFDMNASIAQEYNFTVFDRKSASKSLNSWNVTRFGTYTKNSKWYLDTVVHQYNYAGQGNSKLFSVNTDYKIDMLLDLDNWTVQTYIDGNLISNGKMGMNECNGIVTSQQIRHKAYEFVISSTNKAGQLNIDNLAIYHYEDEWSKPVVGKEKRVLVSDNFEMPAGRPTHEYRVEPFTPAAYASIQSNTYTDGVLTKGFEVADDPTGADNKVLKFVHTTGWSNSARYRLSKLLSPATGFENCGSLQVDSGIVEISYKVYSEIGNAYVIAYGSDFSSNGAISNYTHSSGYVTGQYFGNMNDKDLQNTYAEAKLNGWHDIRMVVDLDNEKISYYIDDCLRSSSKDLLLTDATKTVSGTQRHPLDKGLKILDIANFNTPGVAYYDDIRISVLEDVAVTNNRLTASQEEKAETVSTVADFMAQTNPNYEVTVYNSTAVAEDMQLIMVVYNEKGRVEKIDLVEAEAAASVTDETTGTVQGKTTRITTGFTDEFRDAVATGKTIKLFVWDGIDTITPITEAMTVN